MVRLERQRETQQGNRQRATLTQPGREARVVPLTLDTRYEAVLAEFRAVGGTEDDLEVLRDEDGNLRDRDDSLMSGGIQFVVISQDGALETRQDLPTDPEERETLLSHLVHGDLEAVSLPEDAGLIGWVNDDGDNRLTLEHNPHAAQLLTALGAELGPRRVFGPLVLTGTTNGSDTMT